MKKFSAMLKKELKELLTLQMILPMLIGSLVFALLGDMIGHEEEKFSEPRDVYVLDFDDTKSSKLVSLALSENGFDVINVTPETGDAKLETENALALAKKSEVSLLITIDKGFEEGINNLVKQEINTYSIIGSFSIFASAGSAKIDATVAAINDFLSDELIRSNFENADPDIIKEPIASVDNTIIGDRSAVVSPAEVTNFITSQTIFIPIIMFIIIIFSSQMIGVSIASEKENKTLETLLSTPVSRLTLVTAKMTAAAFAALVMASVYMAGFGFYMKGITGGSLQTDQSSVSAIESLGLSLSTSGYLLLGLSLFLSILIALATAMILGAFAEDVKKVQGLLAPMVFLIMIPYLFSMFVDIPNASVFLKILVYIIPFSHTFLAAPNLFLHNYGIIYIGAAYQFAVFVLLALTATRIFSSDKILTLKLNFNRKRSG